MRQLLCLLIMIWMVMTFCTRTGAQPSPAAAPAVDAANLPAECYLFTSFRGNGDGLHLAWSTDGIQWQPLNNDRAFLTSAVGGKLMRDPCILQGPDGTFHLVWTSGWYEKMIGYASSKDLINWTTPKAIPVMQHEPQAANSWAPELVYDDVNQQFIIYWATTIPGRFPGDENGDRGTGGVGLNHRIYCTTTKDFETFTPTRLFFDPGFSVIDSTIARDGNRFVMVFKDETLRPPKKHLRVATAEKIDGPYTVVSEAFTPAGEWVEGPSLIKVDDGWVLYFDMYRAHRYGAMKTKDFMTWDNITDQLKFNVRDVRHGTAFKVKRDVLQKILASPATPENASAP
jgi:hypothetical protein